MSNRNGILQRLHIRIVAYLKTKRFGLVNEIESIAYMRVVDHHSIIGHRCASGALGLVQQCELTTTWEANDVDQQDDA